MNHTNQQRILVFKQLNSAEPKTKGILAHGNGQFVLNEVAIEPHLPEIIDDAGPYLPAHLDADLVLDFVKHPDISYELAIKCEQENIPIIASGKKYHSEWAYTPPT